jgi:hypothetical protein
MKYTNQYFTVRKFMKFLETCLKLLLLFLKVLEILKRMRA